MHLGLRFVAVALLAALATVALLDAATRLFEGGSDPRSHWVDAALRRKTELARATASPQVLLAGGSNVNYGYSAQQIEEATGARATNLAVHAGLGRRHVLRHAEAVARPGDLVVLSLEYMLYAPPFRDPAERYQGYLHERAYVDSLPLLERLLLLGSLAPRDWVSLWRARFGPWPAGPWENPLTLGPRGDQMGNDAPNVPRQRSSYGRESLDPDLSAELASFASRLRTRGVDVVLAYPNLRRAVFQRKIDAAYDAALRRAVEAAGLRLVGTAEGAAFPDAEWYDTDYHVTRDGARRATERLLRDLRTAGIALPGARTP